MVEKSEVEKIIDMPTEDVLVELMERQLEWDKMSEEEKNLHLFCEFVAQSAKNQRDRINNL